MEHLTHSRCTGMAKARVSSVLLLQHSPDNYTSSINKHPIASLPPLTGFKKTKECFTAVWYLPRGLCSLLGEVWGILLMEPCNNSVRQKAAPQARS